MHEIRPPGHPPAPLPHPGRYCGVNAQGDIDSGACLSVFVCVFGALWLCLWGSVSVSVRRLGHRALPPAPAPPLPARSSVLWDGEEGSSKPGMIARYQKSC